jgi:hypothetical protein
MKSITETTKKVRNTKSKTIQAVENAPTSSSTDKNKEEQKNIKNNDTSLNDDNSDDEFYQTVKKFVPPTCSTIIFMALDGSKVEKKLNDRILDYETLQREIARVLPKNNSNTLYIIQNQHGETLTSTSSFQKVDVIKLREIYIKPNLESVQKLGCKWEHEEYHGIVNSYKKTNILLNAT